MGVDDLRQEIKMLGVDMPKKMGDTEWSSIVDALKRDGAWDKMWKLLTVAPPNWSAEMMLSMIKAGWKPDNRYAELWEELRRLCPGEGRDLTPPINDSRILEGHTQYISCLSISPDSKIMATGSHDNTVCLWSLPDGEYISKLEGHTNAVKCLSISPDGKILATGGSGNLNQDTFVHFWSLPDGEHIRTLREYSSSLESLKYLSISPDGKILFTSHGYDKAVWLWSLPDGERIKLPQVRPYPIGYPCISPDGKILVATGSDDNTVCLWSLPDGEHIRTLDKSRLLDISPDGKILATGGTEQRDISVRLWSLPDGEHIITLGSSRTTLRESRTGWVYDLSISPNGSILATTCRDHTIHLWSLPDGEHIRTLEGHADAADCLSISPDGKILVTSHFDDKAVWLWSLPDGEHIRALDKSRLLGISPDGKILATGSYDDNTVRLWSLTYGKHISKLEAMAHANYDDWSYVCSVIQMKLASKEEEGKWLFLEALFRLKIEIG